MLIRKSKVQKPIQYDTVCVGKCMHRKGLGRYIKKTANRGFLPKETGHLEWENYFSLVFNQVNTISIL